MVRLERNSIEYPDSFLTMQLLELDPRAAEERAGVVCHRYPFSALFFGNLRDACPVVWHNDLVASHDVSNEIV